MDSTQRKFARSLRVWLLLAWASAASMMLSSGVQAVQTNVTSICSPSDPAPLVVKGTTTYVCVNVNNQYRTLFTPVADRFTVLRISDCGYFLLARRCCGNLGFIANCFAPMLCCSVERYSCRCEPSGCIPHCVESEVPHELQALLVRLDRSHLAVYDCHHIRQEGRRPRRKLG
jgi:hypothetical protein